MNEIKATKGEKIGAIVTATIAVLFVLLVVIGVNTLINFTHPTPITPTVIPPSLYPDFSVIKGENPDPLMRSISLISNCLKLKDGCVNNTPASKELDGQKGTYKVTGAFSRAYLYTDIAVDYGRPLTSWDDLYFTIGGYGGHIILDENLLPVPPGDTSRYLFNLKSLSYYRTLQDKVSKTGIKNINVFSLLQDGNTFEAHVSISSDRAGRVMKEVSIYYECSQGSECNIEKIK